VDEVQSYLDIREINGYSIQYTTFYPSKSGFSNAETDRGLLQSIRCLVYIGLPTNPQFVGPQDPSALAKHILRSVGPSGENREYLYMLEESLLNLSPESEDNHVVDLARRCRILQISDKWHRRVSANASRDVIGHDLKRVGNTEAQEEVEIDATITAHINEASSVNSSC